MAKSWPANSERSLQALNEEEKEIMGSEGLLELINQIFQYSYLQVGLEESA